MRIYLGITALAVAVSAALSLPSEAARRKAPRSWQQEAPLKDCTRLNGRFGYYGNPWCTRAEQDAWDRATSRQAR